MIEHYITWFLFWSAYGILSTFFPTDEMVTRPVAQITKKKIVNKLLINSLVTASSIPILAYIPQLIFLPTIWYGYIIKYILFGIIAEIWFYYTHRLMHHKWFYRWHSDHHAFVQSCAIAALYCSPIEMMFVQQLSIAIPYQLLGFSFYEIIMVNTFVAFSLLRGHAGIYFRKDLSPWLPKYMLSALDHDIHHRLLTCNFGVLYILDRIHGTYQSELNYHG